ncbi:MAG: aminotransferase class I/II-fold pyridoxal phosphate-dependent enzyme [Thermoplasmata archaeon]
MITERIRQVKLHDIRKLFEMADDSTINLGQGQPDFQPPTDVIDEVHRAMRAGNNMYGSHFGLTELRKEIASVYSPLKTDITKDNVLITVGATQGLRITLESFVDIGDEVLYPDPGFVLFSPHIELARGRPVSYPIKKDSEFVPDIDDLELCRTDKTKALIVNSPSNPTGGVIPESRVKEIVEWAQEHDILIISDEVYDKFVYRGKHVSFLRDYDNVVMVNSFSKSFAMTGWRLGFMITRDDWIQKLGSIHSYNIACPINPIQHAVLYALREKTDFVDEMISTFKERKKLMIDGLNDITGFDCITPKGAFYVFPSYDFDIPSRQLALKLLKEGVLTAPGRTFGAAGEDHLRLSYANSSENIERGLEIIRKFSRSYK